MLSVLQLYARQIDEHTVTAAAQKFYSANYRLRQSKQKSVSMNGNLQLSKIFYKDNPGIAQQNDTVAVYVFSNPNGNGFVIMSGETSLPPILGYSHESNFDANNIPPQLTEIINRWVETASKHSNGASTGNKNEQQWNELLDNDAASLNQSTAADVQPLLTTKWGQGQYYNDKCPLIDSQHALAGCVAIAMAQIMKFWNYPDFGTGSTSYDSFGTLINVDFGETTYNWNDMPDFLTAPNDAVATLCFQAGAAAGTQYRLSSSYAFVNWTYEAFKRFFCFNSGFTYNSYHNLTMSQLKEIIQTDLAKGYPVLVTGNNDSNVGHAYVCDGIQNNLFHINFGWNGMSDGYYNLENEVEYNKNFEVIYNLTPINNGILVSDRQPAIGQTIRVEVLSNRTNPELNVSPNASVVKDARNPKLFYVTFPNMGAYQLSSTGVNSTTVSVAFTVYKEDFFNSEACGQSAPVRWFDFENDGDLDLYASFGGFYENVAGQLISKDVGLPDTYNGSFQVLDYDNDSYLDAAVMEGQFVNNNFVMDVAIYKNNNGTGFVKQNFNLPTLGGGSIIPCDFNNDGWVDLVVYGIDYAKNDGIKYLIILKNNNGAGFENVGEFHPSDGFRQEGLLACGDFDNDGKFDIIVRNSYGSSYILFKNNGNFNFTQTNVALNGTEISSADFNNDGKIDLVSSYYSVVNIGYNTNGQVFNTTTINLDKPLNYNRCGVADVDCDGKTDFFVTRTSTDGRQRVGFNMFLNKGSSFEYLPDIGTNYTGPDADFGDFDNNGYPDVAIGNSVLKNVKGNGKFTPNTPPTAPGNLSSYCDRNSVVLSWDRATDAQTRSAGLSYNLRIGTSPGACDIMSPMSDPTTGKRKVAGMGNVYQNVSYAVNNLTAGRYYWSVQAIDNGHMGSKFSPEQSFVITGLPGTITAVTGISINKTSVTMFIGDTMQLTASVSPSDATNRSVIWSSSEKTIVDVDVTGLITAKSIGTATIIVTTPDGDKTATCTVTVSMQPATAIKNISIDNLKLYPNPVKDELFVQSECPVQKVEIFDLSGKTVINAQWPTGKSTINVSALPAGIYILKAETVQGIVIKKFIKQ